MNGDQGQSAWYMRQEASRIIDMIMGSDDNVKVDIMCKLLSDMHGLVMERSRMEHKMIDKFGMEL